MSTRLKTSFKLAKSFTPIYTGGSIAVSEDGQRIYTTLNEEVVCTDVASGERIHLFKGDTSVVTTLALSRENATSAGVLAVAHRSLALRFYSLEDFTLARSVARAHDAPITVAVSDPTGSLFATGSADGIVKVWDAKHAHCTHVFRGHGGVVSSLFFDVDTTANATGRKTRPPRLVSASDDCRVRVWALNTRKSLLVLDGHSSVVRGLAVTGDGKTLVSGGRDSVFNVWDLPSGELKSTTPVFETLEAIGIVEVPSTSGDKGRKGKQKATDSGVKSLLWTAGDSGTVKLWDIETGQRITTGDSTAEEDDQGASSSATHEILHTSTNSTSLVTAHVDQNLVFHRLPTIRPFRHMVGFNDEVIDLLYLNSASSSTPSSSSSPETHLAVATNSDLIRVYDLQTFNTTLLPGHADVVLCLARNKAGNVLLSGSKDRTARIWMPSGSDSMQENDGDESAYSSWKCVAVCEGHLGSIGAVTIARREGGYAATASQDKTVKIWDIASLEAGSGDAAPSAPVKAKALATLKVHDKEINSLDISPNDKLLATGSQDRTAKLFAIEYSAPTKARTAPEAKVVPLGIFKGHKRGVWSVKFSPADQVLATASGDRTIKLWSINDFTCLKTFEGHTNTVLRIDYLPAGNQLASCGSDGLVKIWNIKDEEDVATLDNHEDKIWALAANSDASMLVSGGADSVISFWNDVTEQEQEEAIALEEETILRVQDLANYVDAKDYRNAFLLALSMDQPRRLLGLLQSILGDDTDEWSSMLAGVLESLAPGDVFRLLEYVRDWNARSRDSDVAQAVLHSLFRTHSAAQILAAAPGATGLEVAYRDAKGSKSVSAGIGDILEALMPYTERHYARADRLEQESAFLDFVLAQMDEYVTEPGTNGMDVDGETVGR